MGDREAFLRRHEAEARAAAGATGEARARFLFTLFGRVIDTRMLLLAAERVVRHGGPAAGVDGISPIDLDRVDMVSLARVLREEVRSGRYRPAPDREKQIPKPENRGTRTLSIPVVADRVLQTAVLLAVQPFADPQLPATTLGGRPGYSTADALIRAEWAATARGRWVWATADARKAFDEVPLADLTDTLRRWFGRTPLCDLLTIIAATGRDRGIRQGGPLSPLLLNAYLADHLDGPLAEAHPHRPTIRWIDDLLATTTNRKEAHDALDEMSARLREAGMTLKDSTTVADLAGGETTEWLGFQLRLTNGELTASVRDTAWERLHQAIELTLREDRPTEDARRTVRGWIDAMRPVNPDRNNTDRVLAILREQGMNDAILAAEVDRWWTEAHTKYREARDKRLNERNDEPGQETGEAVEPTASPAGIFALSVPNPGTDPDQSSTPDRLGHNCDGIVATTESLTVRNVSTPERHATGDTQEPVRSAGPALILPDPADDARAGRTRSPGRCRSPPATRREVSAC